MKVTGWQRDTKWKSTTNSNNSEAIRRLRDSICRRAHGGGRAPRNFRYPSAVFSGSGGSGLANFAGSIGALSSIEVNSVTDRPSTQVFVTRKGTLIPETSR